MKNLNNIQQFKQHHPQISTGVYVHHSATIIGQVSIDEHSSVWPGAVIRGDINFIRIGKNTNIQDLSILHVNHRSKDDPEGSPLTIGDNVTIGHTVILHVCWVQIMEISHSNFCTDSQHCHLFNRPSKSFANFVHSPRQ